MSIFTLFQEENAEIDKKIGPPLYYDSHEEETGMEGLVGFTY